MQGLKFRILLDSDSNAEVFRDIIVSDESDFERFYNAILHAFELKGDQMASFYVSNESWDKGHEINLMDMSYDDDALDQPANVMNKAIIKDFITEPDQKFILVYDFMAMMIFLIELIESNLPIPDQPIEALRVGQTSKHEERQQTENNESDIFMAGGGVLLEDELEEEDELGFNDYDDDYNEGDLDGYHDPGY